MNKEEKKILKFLIEKELAALKSDEKKVGFASPGFIESMDKYEHVLNDLLKKLE